MAEVMQVTALDPYEELTAAGRAMFAEIYRQAEAGDVRGAYQAALEFAEAVGGGKVFIERTRIPEALAEHIVYAIEQERRLQRKAKHGKEITDLDLEIAQDLSRIARMLLDECTAPVDDERTV